MHLTAEPIPKPEPDELELVESTVAGAAQPGTAQQVTGRETKVLTEKHRPFPGGNRGNQCETHVERIAS